MGKISTTTESKNFSNRIKAQFGIFLKLSTLMFSRYLGEHLGEVQIVSESFFIEDFKYQN